MLKYLSIFSAACIAFLVPAAEAQNLFVLPGSGSTNTAVTVLSPGTLGSVAAFPAGAGPFSVFSTPDGSRFYIVSNSGSQTVTEVGSTFTGQVSLGNLGLGATAGAITPDGRRLVVAAGSLHVFDTSTNNDLLPNGLANVSSLIDVAVSLDGTQAFALSVSGSGSTLYEINLSSLGVVATLPIPGQASGVAVGPNGFVYVSTVNQLIEINPPTFTVTPSGTIPLNAAPSRAVFTPDGKFALLINRTPITGSSVIEVDLTSHLVANTIPNFNTVIDQLLVASNNQVFATSAQTQSLYQITLVPFNIAPASPAGFQFNSVTAAALSREVAGGTQTTAHYLYVASGSTLYRVDLTTNQLAGQQALSSSGGSLVLAGAANTAGAPASILQYGNSQSLSAGGVSAPLVVRVLDATGLPVSGAVVTFANTSGAILSNTTTTTTPDGFAQTIVTAPTVNGLFTVSASTANSLSVNFNLTVGSGNVGTGQGATITVIAGQGQTVQEFGTTTGGISGVPFTVAVRDVNGNLVSGAPVTFTVVSGSGSIFGGSATNSAVVNTDATGQAMTTFTASSTGGLDFVQTQVNASAPGTNTVTFYITTTPFQSPLTGVIQKPSVGSTITGQAGATLAGAIAGAISSAHGSPVANVGLVVTTTPLTGMPTAACADPSGSGTALSNTSGIVTCDLVLGPSIGTGSMAVRIGAQIFTFQLVVTPGPPSKVVKVQGDNQSGSPGQTLPQALVVSVTDVGGNLLPGVPVSFTVTPAGAVTLVNTINSTDSNGRASTLARLGNIAGPAQVVVTAGTGTATFTINVNIPVSGVQVSSGNNQTAQIGTAFGSPIAVLVTDSSSKPVSGAQVTFAVAGGSATLSSPTANTDATGKAQVTVTAGQSAGPITITASVGSVSTSFSLTSVLPGPTNITFLNGASFQPGISPCSVAVIQGLGIANGIQGTVSPNAIIGPLPTSFQGAQILFNNIPAPIFYISNALGVQQIGVQVPCELSPGSATVTINAPGGGSATIQNVAIQQYSPGVFTTFYGTQPYAVAIRNDGSYVSPSNPAHPGDNVCIFATGLGQVSPRSVTNGSGVPGQNVLVPVQAGVNNAGVPLISATALPGVVGVDMVCFSVPSNTQTGPYQPIGLLLTDAGNNSIFGQGTFIPIQ